LRALLDTHALIWWAENDPRLGAEARSVLEAADGTVLVSAISIYEMRLKDNLGKLPSGRSLLADLDGYFEEQGFVTLDLSARHADLAGRLPLRHRDPFDRMLMAQAILEGIPILSNEKPFDDFGVRRLW
jgi:PIN domain nuclease of toxin-antitoxin system